MTATGTYDDGSQKTLTSGVVWKTDATTSSSDLVRTAPPGTSIRSGPLNPAARSASSPCDGGPSGMRLRPARRTGPR